MSPTKQEILTASTSKCEFRSPIVPRRSAGYQPRQRAFIPISTRTKNPPVPKLNSFAPIIDEVLKADEKAPRKQRHNVGKHRRRER